MSKSARIIVIVLGVGVFLGISLLLALGLTATNRERSAVLGLLEAQARGDADAMLRDLPACARVPACADGVRRVAARTNADGEVEILRYDPSAQFVMAERTGTGRVAWRAGGGLSVVQCVRVRRGGALAGATVELMSIGAPIEREGSC